MKVNNHKLKAMLLKRGWQVEDNGCWTWLGSRFGNGYGRITLTTGGVGVHRLAYEAWVGEIPEGLLIRHRCDNKICMNPNHLELGTNRDNYSDMVERHRRNAPKGDNHYATKIDTQKARKVYSMWLSGDYKMRELAKLFSVSNQTITNVIKKMKVEGI